MEVNGIYKFYEVEPEINKVLEELKNIWDGNFGTLKTVKHQIDLAPPENKKVHYAPYRGGRATDQLEES